MVAVVRAVLPLRENRAADKEGQEKADQSMLMVVLRQRKKERKGLMATAIRQAGPRLRPLVLISPLFWLGQSSGGWVDLQLYPSNIFSCFVVWGRSGQINSSGCWRAEQEKWQKIDFREESGDY
uniref:Uncharacterized protein n=1 Tax=Ditylenchus dipsaci TaxID=166011 RepID=A0A915CX57_9BILA